MVAQIPAPESCPLCTRRAIFGHKETHYDQGARYDLYECSLCRAQFWMPLKNPGAEWYEHDARYSGANDDPPREPYWTHRKVISFLKGREGKVLDIGCGTGNFLSWAKENGWDAYGIDFDGNAVRAAKEIFGLPNVEQNSIEQYVANHRDYLGSFDLIGFFDVFEHLDNHNEFAEQVKLLLRAGGYVAMSMPYRNGSRFMQKGDEPPRHLTRWDAQSLATFWERHGFEIAYIKPMRIPLYRVVIKFRHKWGRSFSMGLVDKAKRVVQTTNPEIKRKKSVPPFVRLVHALAKTKDFTLFGIPAFFYWLSLQPSHNRYDGLYAIMRKN